MTNPSQKSEHLQYLLTAYIFENLSAAGKVEVESHLQKCEQCRQALVELRLTLALSEAAFDEGGKTYVFEERRRQRVMDAARASRYGLLPRMERRILKIAPWKLASAAAMVLVLAVGAALFRTMGSSRRFANETAAMASTKAFAEAEDIYRRTDYDKEGVLEYTEKPKGANSLYESKADERDVKAIDRAFGEAEVLGKGGGIADRRTAEKGAAQRGVVGEWLENAEGEKPANSRVDAGVPSKSGLADSNGRVVGVPNPHTRALTNNAPPSTNSPAQTPPPNSTTRADPFKTFTFGAGTDPKQTLPPPPPVAAPTTPPSSHSMAAGVARRTEDEILAADQHAARPPARLPAVRAQFESTENAPDRAYKKGIDAKGNDNGVEIIDDAPISAGESRSVILGTKKPATVAAPAEGWDSAAGGKPAADNDRGTKEELAKFRKEIAQQRQTEQPKQSIDKVLESKYGPNASVTQKDAQQNNAWRYSVDGQQPPLASSDFALGKKVGTQDGERWGRSEPEKRAGAEAALQLQEQKMQEAITRFRELETREFPGPAFDPASPAVGQKLEKELALKTEPGITEFDEKKVTPSEPAAAGMGLAADENGQGRGAFGNRSPNPAKPKIVSKPASGGASVDDLFSVAEGAPNTADPKAGYLFTPPAKNEPQPAVNYVAPDTDISVIERRFKDVGAVADSQNLGFEAQSGKNGGRRAAGKAYSGVDDDGEQIRADHGVKPSDTVTPKFYYKNVAEGDRLPPKETKKRDNAYPKGIDLAGGTELEYVLRYKVDNSAPEPIVPLEKQKKVAPVVTNEIMYDEKIKPEAGDRLAGAFNDNFEKHQMKTAEPLVSSTEPKMPAIFDGFVELAKPVPAEKPAPNADPFANFTFGAGVSSLESVVGEVKPNADNFGDDSTKKLSIAAKDAEIRRHDNALHAQADADKKKLEEANKQLGAQNVQLREKNANTMAGSERLELEAEKDRVSQEMIKLKGVLIKQQQAVIVDRPGADDRARQEKQEMERDLDLASKQLQSRENRPQDWYKHDFINGNVEGFDFTKGRPFTGTGTVDGTAGNALAFQIEDVNGNNDFVALQGKPAQKAAADEQFQRDLEKLKRDLSRPFSTVGDEDEGDKLGAVQKQPPNGQPVLRGFITETKDASGNPAAPVSSWSSAFPYDVTNGISRSWLGDLSVAKAPERATDPKTGSGASSQVGSIINNTINFFSDNPETISGFDAIGQSQGLDPNILTGDFGDIRRLGDSTGLIQPRQPVLPSDKFPAPFPEIPKPGDIARGNNKVDPDEILAAELATAAFTDPKGSVDFAERLEQIARRTNPDIHVSRIMQGQQKDDAKDTFMIEGQVSDQRAMAEFFSVVDNMVGGNGKFEPVADDGGTLAAGGAGSDLNIRGIKVGTQQILRNQNSRLLSSVRTNDEVNLAQRAQASHEFTLRGFRALREDNPKLTLREYAKRPVPPTPAPLTDEGLDEDEYINRYGIRPFVDAARDHLSTFSMDVDTASYTRARALLRDGKLPDAEAVRTEEFVNYFKQAYAVCTDEAFGVFAEGGPSPFGTSQNLELLKIGIKSRDPKPGERRAAVLTIVVDTSGSMGRGSPLPLRERADRAQRVRGEGWGGTEASGARLTLVKNALRKLVEQLRPEDAISIVTFGEKAELVLPRTQARQKQRIADAINTLAPRGGTNVESGLNLAYRMADEAYSADAVNRVILCSDGVANVGSQGPDEILKTVRVFAARGIDLVTVGFGMGEYNDEMMAKLADNGNGSSYFCDTQAEAEKIFKEQLPPHYNVLARDAKVQVDFDPKVVSRYRLLGYEKRKIADKDFRNDAIDAGEVAHSTLVTALYEIQRAPGAHGSFGKVYLRWKDATLRHLPVIERNFPISEGIFAGSLSRTSPDFRLLACVAEFAELLKSSRWSRDGSYALILSHLDRLPQAFQTRADVKELRELIAKAQELSVKCWMEKP